MFDTIDAPLSAAALKNQPTVLYEMLFELICFATLSHLKHELSTKIFYTAQPFTARVADLHFIKSEAVTPYRNTRLARPTVATQAQKTPRMSGQRMLICTQTC